MSRWYRLLCQRSKEKAASWGIATCDVRTVEAKCSLQCRQSVLKPHRAVLPYLISGTKLQIAAYNAGNLD
jgi:hypothetical protein